MKVRLDETFVSYKAELIKSTLLEDYPTGGPLDQPSGAAGKKRGRKLAPATGDVRNEGPRV